MVKCQPTSLVRAFLLVTLELSAAGKKIWVTNAIWERKRTAQYNKVNTRFELYGVSPTWYGLCLSKGDLPTKYLKVAYTASTQERMVATLWTRRSFWEAIAIRGEISRVSWGNIKRFYEGRRRKELYLRPMALDCCCMIDPCTGLQVRGVKADSGTLSSPYSHQKRLSTRTYTVQTTCKEVQKDWKQSVNHNNLNTYRVWFVFLWAGSLRMPWEKFHFRPSALICIVYLAGNQCMLGAVLNSNVSCTFEVGSFDVTFSHRVAVNCSRLTCTTVRLLVLVVARARLIQASGLQCLCISDSIRCDAE